MICSEHLCIPPSSTGEVIHKLPQHATIDEHLLEVVDNKTAMQSSDLTNSNDNGNTVRAEDCSVSEESTLTQLSDELSESATIYQSSTTEISG